MGGGGGGWTLVIVLFIAGSHLSEKIPDVQTQ